VTSSLRRLEAALRGSKLNTGFIQSANPFVTLYPVMMNYCNACISFCAFVSKFLLNERLCMPN
jgi:hypothetical protein